MDISLIICTYNRADRLNETIKSITNLCIPAKIKWELIIVDNNSNDLTRSIVDGYLNVFGENLRYFQEYKQGKSFALNTAIKLAKGQILAFTDDDVILHSHWLSEILKAFEDNSIIGIGGKILPIWPCEKPIWYSENGPYKLMSVIVEYDLGDEIIFVNKPPYGANYAFRKEVFKKYGYFRTDLGPKRRLLMRGEDTEFCTRLLENGENITYLPTAVVYHPVDLERLEKKYFQKFYFHYGRMQQKLSNQSSVVHYFGIPRFLLLNSMKNLVTWITSINIKRRFYYKLQFYRLIGAVVESIKV